MAPSPDHPDQARGYVIPIGGAEERTGSMLVLRRFVKLCGGTRARIVIIPTASMLQNTGHRYEEIFGEIGVRSAQSIAINERADCERENYLEALNRASGIFITGGNQLRLSTILGGTPVAQAIRRLNAAGTHVAGTSAGAAIMPDHMIAGGSTGLAPSGDGVNLAPGLGLTRALLIDQHFSQRDRLGRLLTAISYNPYMIGAGIDEDTALFIDHQQCFEVVGSGTVTILDPSDLTYSSMGRASRDDALSLLNLRLHILSNGCHYDIDKRLASPPD